MTTNSDKNLIVKYLNGDEKSLEILIRRYLKPIYAFVYRYVKNVDEAEDITQAVFVKMWRHLKKFDKNKSFKTWLFSIAKNTSIDFLKKKKPIPFSEFDTQEGVNIIAETFSDAAPLPSEIFERKELAEALEAAIEKLSLKYQMVLFLRYNDHFSFQEIAEILEEPLDTIKSRHRRALIQLKKILSENPLHQK